MWLAVTATWLSTLLFLFRVNVVFLDFKPARCMFVLLWATAAIAAGFNPFFFTAGSTQPTNLCVVTFSNKLRLIPPLTVAIFDNTVYASILYRTINFYAPHNKWARFKAFFTGRDTGPVYKALLRSGQIYFLCVPPVITLFTQSVDLRRQSHARPRRGSLVH